MDYEKEIPFGAFDSELMHQEINIPEGFEATIEGNKIILTKTESEDGKNKRISKEITRFLKQNNGWNREWLNWLEKQGGKNDSDVKDYNSIDPHFGKSIDKIEQKFKNGQWIVWQNKCYKVNYNGCGYELIDQNGLRTSLEYGTVDKSAHLLTIDDVQNGCKFGAKWQGKHDVSEDWSEEDEEHIHSLLDRLEGMCKKGSTFITTRFAVSQDMDWLKSLKGRVQPQPKQEWGKEDIRNIENIDSVLFYDKDLPEDTCVRLRNWLKSLRPQPKQWWGEEDERIYQSIIDDTVQENQLDSKQIDWLKSIKSRVQPKQEWSEEDEQLVKWSINNLTELKDRFGEEYGKVGKCIDWLKSLRPQNHWETSKEQMSRLKWIAHQKARRL